MRSRSRDDLLPRQVSIRSRLCSREMPRSAYAQRTTKTFQSAPGFAAGRCQRCRCQMAAIIRFNPLPALQPGDAQSAPAPGAPLVVSIRSRLCSREMPTGCAAIRGGRRVSIRSRLCSREMLAKKLRDHRAHQFQSAPGFAAGRCRCSRLGPSAQRCFNPLPALQPGDARCRRTPAAPRCRFQSAPGFAAGRCRPTRPCSAEPSSFQSAPGFAAGRCATRPRRAALPNPFQSAPGFAAGRCSPANTDRHLISCFNPLPALQPGDASATLSDMSWSW